MGNEPSTAASTAATEPTTTSGVDVKPVNATATESPSARATSTNIQFGAPHALVIIACIATAAFLAPSGMGVHDVLLLIAGAGGIGAAVVVAVMAGGRSTSGRIGRFMRAYFTSKN